MTKETDRRPAVSQTESSGSSSHLTLSDRGPKPRVAFFVATVAGLGYLPKAPGTWGSLAGVFVYWSWLRFYGVTSPLDTVVRYGFRSGAYRANPAWEGVTFVTMMILIIGVVTAQTVSTYSGLQDPQFVVIDEVFGQMFTYLIALAPLNWKYLLLGFILFRVFDIWKPFPARQAESLPGGWGIMADDWIAGIYAGLGLWIARAFGL
jgi:phosphatidylglycerophosphatase A